MNKLSTGSLVISLDFELMWGIIDVLTKEGYGKTNVKYVPEAIRGMLALFKEYEVHATFATVGMIMYQNPQTLLKDLPEVHPTYLNKALSPYENDYIYKITKEEESLFFQPEIVKEILSQKGLEIGTHTFCHYYCWEQGQNINQFEADIHKAIDVAKKRGLLIKSIVFPRNQVSYEYLKICSQNGILSFRGNAAKYFNEPKNKFENIKNRICRLLDAYINIGGNTTIPYREIQRINGVFNVQASRMLRPYSNRLSFLESLRLRRIRKEMLHAAQNGEMYHLWWHPHNFGENLEKNLNFLEKILKIYRECHERYGMQSYNMNEIQELLSKTL